MKIAKRQICRYNSEFSPHDLARFYGRGGSRGSNLTRTKVDKMMKWRLACFFAWILIMGSIVFELKFTDHDPDGRQIIALVAFTITLAFYPGRYLRVIKGWLSFCWFLRRYLSRDCFFNLSAAPCQIWRKIKLNLTPVAVSLK